MHHQPNPFSTRFIRPGAIPFHFEPGQSAEGIVESLKANHWLGEIIGPHGTGKSTLLETLIPLMEAQGRQVLHLKLTAAQPKLSLRELFGGTWNRATQVIIDGYEQLGAFARYLLAARRILSGAGMLVTAHQPTGLQTLYKTEASEQLVRQLVEHLTRTSEANIGEADIAQALQASPSNVRDALFRLYDLYESRKVAAS